MTILAETQPSNAIAAAIAFFVLLIIIGFLICDYLYRKD